MSLARIPHITPNAPLRGQSQPHTVPPRLQILALLARGHPSLGESGLRQPREVHSDNVSIEPRPSCHLRDCGSKVAQHHKGPTASRGIRPPSSASPIRRLQAAGGAIQEAFPPFADPASRAHPGEIRPLGTLSQTAVQAQPQSHRSQESGHSSHRPSTLRALAAQASKSSPSGAGGSHFSSSALFSGHRSRLSQAS